MTTTKTPQPSKKKKKDDLQDILDEVETLKSEEEKNEKKKVTQGKEKKLESKIEILTEKNTELEEKFLRVNADIQNIRRRAEEASIKARKDGAIQTLTPFLETMDTFSRAMENIPKEISNTPFIEGIISVQKTLSSTLEQIGIEYFGAIGDDFDAKKHDSMMISPDAESGKIAQVFEKGIMFKGKILRHAKVSAGA